MSPSLTGGAHGYRVKVGFRAACVVSVPVVRPASKRCTGEPQRSKGRRGRVNYGIARSESQVVLAVVPVRWQSSLHVRPARTVRSNLVSAYAGGTVS